MVTDDSVETGGVKNFVKISLSCIISERNAFLYYVQKLKMASKISSELSYLALFPSKAVTQDGLQKWRENDFWQKEPYEFHQHHSISQHF